MRIKTFAQQFGGRAYITATFGRASYAGSHGRLVKKPTAALESAINQGRVAAVTARGLIEMQGGALRACSSGISIETSARALAIAW